MSGVKAWNGTSWDAVAAVNVTGSGSCDPTNLTEMAQRDGAMTILDFQETTGTSMTDRAVGGRAGSTYGSGVTLNQTPPGDLLGAIDLAGSAETTQRVNLSTYMTDQGSIVLVPWSFEMVAKIDGPGSVGLTQYATLVGRASTVRYLVDASTGAMLMQNSGNTTAASSSFPIGSWFHMIHSYDPNSSPTFSKLYVNGSEVTLTGQADVVSSLLSGYLGSYNGSNYLLNGGIAFFAIYPWPIRSATLASDHYTMSGL